MSNARSGNYCQPRCDEATTEVGQMLTHQTRVHTHLDDVASTGTLCTPTISGQLDIGLATSWVAT